MFRYMAFIWNCDDTAQTELADRLTERLRETETVWWCALAQPGVRVYCTGERSGSTGVRTLSDKKGVVLGSLFRRHSNNPHSFEIEKSEFDAAASARIVASGGRELITRYWGNYVAVVHEGRRTWILCGPAASLPCLHVRHQHINVYFSFMEDCAQLRLCSFSINWDSVAAHLIAPAQAESTGLREVSQVQPGECVSIDNGRVSKQVYWDAAEIAQSDVIEDIHDATAMLRSAVRSCIHAWAACHKSIMLNLSGGLDSSIVLACLSDAPTCPDVTCVTEYSFGADSDEREYARLATRMMKSCFHVERQRAESVRLERMLQATRAAVPQSYFGRAELTGWQAELARQHDATAVFSGSGGDQLFYQNTARLTVADFIRRHGIRPSLLRIAYNGAQVDGLSIWRALRDGLYDGVLSRQYDPLAEVFPFRTLVSAEVIDALRAKRASIKSSRRSEPGKLWQIYTLSIAPDYYDPMGRHGDPDQIAPLLSQPVIEAVLRIPTYVLMVGGWDRGLARRAFADELPPEIGKRRSKGGTAEYTYDLLKANLPFVRELLLDGLLVRHGLLDRAKITEALSQRPSGVMKGMAEIVSDVSTEAWLRMWVERDQHIAA